MDAFHPRPAFHPFVGQNGAGSCCRKKTPCAAVTPHIDTADAASSDMEDGTDHVRSYGTTTYSAKAPGRSLREHAGGGVSWYEESREGELTSLEEAGHTRASLGPRVVGPREVGASGNHDAGKVRPDDALVLLRERRADVQRVDGVERDGVYLD